MDNALLSIAVYCITRFPFPVDAIQFSKMLEPHHKENRLLHPSRDKWSEEVCVNKKVKTPDKFKI